MKKQLLIIGFVWPEPTSSAAGSRILQIVDLFQRLHYTIWFASAAKFSDKTFDLTTIGVKTQAIAINDSSFDTFLVEINPELVLFDRFMTEEQFGWRVAEHCPKALRLLDTEDFHGLRKGREDAYMNSVAFGITHLQNDITKRELASMYRCDLSLMISEAEIEILKKTLCFNTRLLHYLPFLLDTTKTSVQDQLPEFSVRHHFITVGNFRHPPNFDAVVFLKEDIWPLIRTQLPDAELHIYGAYTSQKIRQLHNKKEGFLIKGYAEDLNTVMQNARVCVAPLRFGAGLKGKLIDAMINGTPCVMSSIAAEGMFGGLSPNGLLGEDAFNFAKCAVDLYSNFNLWQKYSKNGFDILESRFEKIEHTHAFKKVLQNITENLEKHREQNFIGQILQHHTLQSTKYLSKWIELKNS